MPSNKTSPVFFYTYVLESTKDGDKYIGYTRDLRRRFEEHQKGESFASYTRRPFELIYYEACRDSEDAKQRERYLKTTAGRRFMAKRLRRFNLHKAWHLK
ncbi:MAG: GIY-YIG nuclease family protein [Candidatus Kerfeldbacteria bacterium]|nr:GIY-YIG nuclease family protein [Candidatus Kerfeldbacteria bacterium]